MRSPHVLLLLHSGLVFAHLSLAWEAGFASALRGHICLIGKEIIARAVGSGLLLSHQHLILTFGVKGGIQVLSLTVEIVIPKHLIIGRIGHVQRLHDGIPVTSIQVRLDAHRLWLSPGNLLLA